LEAIVLSAVEHPLRSIHREFAQAAFQIKNSNSTEAADLPFWAQFPKCGQLGSLECSQKDCTCARRGCDPAWLAKGRAEG